MTDRKEQISEVFYLPEGYVSINMPRHLSIDDIKDLEEYITGLLARMKRRVERT